MGDLSEIIDNNSKDPDSLTMKVSWSSLFPSPSGELGCNKVSFQQNKNSMYSASLLYFLQSSMEYRQFSSTCLLGLWVPFHTVATIPYLLQPFPICCILSFSWPSPVVFRSLSLSFEFSYGFQNWPSVFRSLSLSFVFPLWVPEEGLCSFLWVWQIHVCFPLDICNSEQWLPLLAAGNLSADKSLTHYWQ